MTSEQQRVVVIGGGLAGLRLAARLGGDVRVLGEEPHVPYNRVLLAEVLAGRYAPEVTALPAAGPALRRGVRAVRIDRAEQVVHCDDGTVEPYGTLVLATGSNPVLPALRGLFEPEGRELPSGVHAFRTMDDCLALSAAVRPGVRAVVIGGGLLGVSAARALAERGAQVVLAQQGERLMERQLDADASALLRTHLTDLGVEIHTECRVRGLSTAPAAPLDAGPPPTSAVPLHAGPTQPPAAPLPGLRPGPRASIAGGAEIAPPALQPADASPNPAPPALEARSAGPNQAAPPPTQPSSPHVQADASRNPAPPVIEAQSAGPNQAAQPPTQPSSPHVQADASQNPAPPAIEARGTGRSPGFSAPPAFEARGRAVPGAARRVTGVEVADGYRLDADVVVLACGVRPRTGLALAAGLEVRTGIVVDDELRTSDPRIHAIGDCAEHAGRVYGLAGPALEQAEALAKVLLGTGRGITTAPPPTPATGTGTGTPTGPDPGPDPDQGPCTPSTYTGTRALTRLTLTAGGDRPLDLAAFGETTPRPGDDVVRLTDATRRTYRKVVVRGDRLVGGVLLGELSSVGALARSWEDGAPLTDAHGLTDLFHLLTDDGGS
ncbi:FAD-dependent oxidoreductase [Streptomyces sp. NBC_00096]|uniref:FAD-dependent oxidoreductase n=1 Tax=Streptomyces sp. NBC_00096 TaxID=2975650 RepID=UPI0032433A3C